MAELSSQFPISVLFYVTSTRIHDIRFIRKIKMALYFWKWPTSCRSACHQYCLLQCPEELSPPRVLYAPVGRSLPVLAASPVTAGSFWMSVLVKLIDQFTSDMTPRYVVRR